MDNSSFVAWWWLPTAKCVSVGAHLWLPVHCKDILYYRILTLSLVLLHRHVSVVIVQVVGTEPFRSWANSLTGANRPIGPWPIRSLTKSLPGPFIPWPFNSLELSLPGLGDTLGPEGAVVELHRPHRVVVPKAQSALRELAVGSGAVPLPRNFFLIFEVKRWVPVDSGCYFLQSIV